MEDYLTPLEALSQRLKATLAGYQRVAVAFSGGVDSAVVAAAAFQACGSNAVAVTAVSPSLASGELAAAEQTARAIGIRHVIIQTREFDNPQYLANPDNRCYFCKSELYRQLSEQRGRLGVDVIVSGTNQDDLGDYRPGLQAAAEFQIRAPLVEVGATKADVRELARLWQLDVAEKPASPCLSSRVAYGVTVTPERVRRIDQAERWLRETLGASQLRVRLHEGELARIELPAEVLARFWSEPATGSNSTISSIVSKLRELGFLFVTIDLQPLRSGSLNALVPLAVRPSPALPEQAAH